MCLKTKENAPKRREKNTKNQPAGAPNKASSLEPSCDLPLLYLLPGKERKLSKCRQAN